MDIDILKVNKVLEEMGYAYPPDAIQAVDEGREWYHPLDPGITYALSPKAKEVIREALDKVRTPYDYEESFRIVETILGHESETTS